MAFGGGGFEFYFFSIYIIPLVHSYEIFSMWDLLCIISCITTITTTSITNLLMSYTSQVRGQDANRTIPLLL